MYDRSTRLDPGVYVRQYVYTDYSLSQYTVVDWCVRAFKERQYVSAVIDSRDRHTDSVRCT